MKKIRKILSWKFLAVILLIGLLILVKNFSNQERISLYAKPKQIQAAVDPTEVLSTKLLGPFRSFANISIWLRAIEYEEQGEFFELNTLYQLALQMQPRNPVVWGYLSDLFIYRISRKMSDDEQRWQNITEGYKILEDGLSKMPSSSELWEKFSIFYQVMTGEMPEKIISQDLESEKSLLKTVPAWFEQSKQLLKNINALQSDEKKRLENFCINHGTALTYGSEYVNFPQYNLLAKETREILSEINSVRAKLAFLAYYRAIAEIGIRPYLFRHSMFRALDILRLNPNEIMVIYALCQDKVERLKGTDFTQISELHKAVYKQALKDFELIETYKNKLGK